MVTEDITFYVMIFSKNNMIRRFNRIFHDWIKVLSNKSVKKEVIFELYIKQVNTRELFYINFRNQIDYKNNHRI